MKIIEVVGAIIIDGDRIFTTQRGYGNFKGGWEFPGGKVEQGETDEEALRREIKEELDVNIKVGEFFYKVDYQYPDFKLLMNCYLCYIVEGVPKLLEHSNAKWLLKEELDTVDWLPADIEVVKKLADN